MADEVGERGNTRKKLALLATIQTLVDSTDDESDDEDEYYNAINFAVINVLEYTKRGRKRRKRHRQNNYFVSVISNFHLDEFKTFFRLSKTSAQYLLDYIVRVCHEENIEGVISCANNGGTPQKPIRERLLLLLWFLASQDKYSSVADRFNFSESTACKAVHTLLFFIADHLMDKVITWPSAAEKQDMMDLYEDSHAFPGVVGMIDGTHITIKRPVERGIDYYNRKDYYSVVLQGVVDANLKFTDINVGWPGKVHDARVFKHSPLYQKGRTLCGNGHILADSAYPLLDWVMTPYRDNGALTPSQIGYNKRHSSIRSIVERAFGILKGRFCRLRFINQKDISVICATIITSCILHNVCIVNGDEFQDALEEDPVPCVEANGDEDEGAQQRGAAKRDNIAANLV